MNALRANVLPILASRGAQASSAREWAICAFPSSGEQAAQLPPRFGCSADQTVTTIEDKFSNWSIQPAQIATSKLSKLACTSLRGRGLALSPAHCTSLQCKLDVSGVSARLFRFVSVWQIDVVCERIARCNSILKAGC